MCAKWIGTFVYICGHSLCGSVDWNPDDPARVTYVFVTPCAGVWIEIAHTVFCFLFFFCHSLCGSVDWNSAFLHSVKQLHPSLPVRECGLKSYVCFVLFDVLRSLPVRECGLKSYHIGRCFNQCRVTPCAGVWIEIESTYTVKMLYAKSLPVRECGLKF